MRAILSLCLCLLFTSLQASNLQRSFAIHPDDTSKKVEVLSMTPEGKESFPLIVLVHGVSMKKGANDFVLTSFEYWVDKGYGVAAVSLPGFGNSDGENDFSGPFTVHALHAALNHLKAQMPVSSIGMISFGLGAFATTLLSSQRDDLACAVIANGGYDLTRLNDENDPLRKSLVDHQVRLEFTKEEILLRSPMEYVAAMRCPLFLIHRKLNPIVKAEEVCCFQDKVNTLGGNCSLVFLNGGEIDYKISHKEVIETAGAWIEQYLNNPSLKFELLPPVFISAE
jgi:dipeptidyl aminopeptidase/acylaminoacyl peptidase